MSNSGMNARLWIDGRPVTAEILREIATLAGFDLDEELKKDMKTENTFWSNVLRQMKMKQGLFLSMVATAIYMLIGCWKRDYMMGRGEYLWVIMQWGYTQHCLGDKFTHYERFMVNPPEEK